MDVYAKQKAAFAARIADGHAAHAYILEGDDGGETRRFALYMASVLLCTGDKPALRTMRELQESAFGRRDAHPDIHLYEPEKNAGFSVETVRSIKKSIYLLPNEGNKKVYILCGAQKMSRSAQNALRNSLRSRRRRRHSSSAATVATRCCRLCFRARC